MSVEDALISAVSERQGVAAANRLCQVSVAKLLVDAAAISWLLPEAGDGGVIGASTDRARRYEDLQFTTGEGPGLDAMADSSPVVVADLEADVSSGRWPGYGRALLACGVRGVLALPVQLGRQQVAALTLFTNQPDSLDGETITLALMAAELAELPLLDLSHDPFQQAAAHPDTAARAEITQIARTEVNRATGMLTVQISTNPAAALVRLRAHAFATARPIDDVAHDIIARRLWLTPD